MASPTWVTGHTTNKSRGLYFQFGEKTRTQKSGTRYLHNERANLQLSLTDSPPRSYNNPFVKSIFAKLGPSMQLVMKERTSTARRRGAHQLLQGTDGFERANRGISSSTHILQKPP